MHKKSGRRGACLQTVVLKNSAKGESTNPVTPATAPKSATPRTPPFYPSILFLFFTLSYAISVQIKYHTPLLGIPRIGNPISPTLHHERGARLDNRMGVSAWIRGRKFPVESAAQCTARRRVIKVMDERVFSTKEEAGGVLLGTVGWPDLF